MRFKNKYVSIFKIYSENLKLLLKYFHDAYNINTCVKWEHVKKIPKYEVFHEISNPITIEDLDKELNRLK